MTNSLEPTGFSHSQSGTGSPHMQSLINAPSLNYQPALMRKTTDSSLYDRAGNCYLNQDSKLLLISNMFQLIT